MSIFDSFNDYMSADGEPDPTIRAIKSGFRHYGMYETEKKLIGGLFPSSEAKLDEVDKRLGIRLKKRALGLPMDDDDYELATNEGLPFRSKGAVAAFGHHASTLIPEPGLLTGGPLSDLMETSFPKNKAAGVLDEAASFLRRAGARAVGGKFGGSVGRLFGRG